MPIGTWILSWFISSQGGTTSEDERQLVLRGDPAVPTSSLFRIRPFSWVFVLPSRDTSNALTDGTPNEEDEPPVASGSNTQLANPGPEDQATQTDPIIDDSQEIIASLKTQLEGANSRVQQLEADLEQSRKQTAESEKSALERLGTLTANHQKTVYNLESKYGQDRSDWERRHKLEIGRWETRSEQARVQMSVMQTESNRLKEECAALRALFKEDDEFSGADIKQAIIDLKVKINDVSNNLLDFWDETRTISPESVPSSLRDLLGEPFVDTLCRPLPDEDDESPFIPMYYVTQTCIVHYLAKVFETFCFGLGEEENGILEKVYDKIYRDEPPMISSQWRILTHSHACSVTSDHKKKAADLISASILEYLKAADSLYGDDSDVADLCGNDLADIAEATLQLIQMTKEKVASTGYKIIAPKCETFRQETMHDALGEQDAGNVLCATELGVVEIVRKKTEQGTFEEAQDVLIKAQVLFERPVKVVQEEVVEEENVKEDGAEEETVKKEDLEEETAQEDADEVAQSTGVDAVHGISNEEVLKDAGVEPADDETEELKVEETAVNGTDHQANALSDVTPPQLVADQLQPATDELDQPKGSEPVDQQSVPNDVHTDGADHVQEGSTEVPVAASSPLPFDLPTPQPNHDVDEAEHENDAPPPPYPSSIPPVAPIDPVEKPDQSEAQ